jgi:hypothetical protein
MILNSRPVMSPDLHRYQLPASDENPEGSWVCRMAYGWLGLVASYICLYTIIETRRAAVAIGKSDIFTMQEVLEGGLWDDPLMDPET